MHEFKMPSLGAEMEAGTLIEWKVKPGDQVKRGDIIAVVDTDKAAVEVEVWQSGTIEQLLVSPGSKVPVGTVLATIQTEQKAAPSPVLVEQHMRGAVAASMPKPTLTSIPSLPSGVESMRSRISPAAKKRAAELRVDLSTIEGTGPQGAITSADVERKVKFTVLVPRSKPSMVSAMAAAMAKSKKEIPHYYLSSQIDVSHALEWLAAKNLERPVTTRILYPVLLLKAVALALKKVPELNGFWENGGFRPAADIHLGVAVSVRGGGLITPALHEVNKKNVDELMISLHDLVNRARSGTLRSSELADSTVTVTNLGEQGAETVFGVIYPPQVALIGFGSVVRRPWVVGEAIALRSIMTATLSGDHRVSDGHRGSLFLSEVGRLLQAPEHL